MLAYLSYSHIALYLEYPLLYKRRYIDGERSEATPAALAFGNAIHQALARFYTQAQEGEPVGLAVLLGKLAAAWQEAADEPRIVYGEREDFGSKAPPAFDLIDAKAPASPRPPGSGRSRRPPPGYGNRTIDSGILPTPFGGGFLCPGKSLAATAVFHFQLPK